VFVQSEKSPTKAPPAPSATGSNPAVPIESLPERRPLSAAVREKIAKMTPIFDGKTLDGWIQAPEAPIRFATEDIRDLAALTKKMTARRDAVAVFLHDTFDETTKTAVRDAASATGVDRPTVSVILRGLNGLVGGGFSLFDVAGFKDVSLRPETEALRQPNPTGWRLARLNRMLLEDAFPTELVRSPAKAWIVKDGAMVSTGAGRGVIYTESNYTHYRLVFQVRQMSGNHVPGVLIFGERPPEGEIGRDALAAIQFQVPNGGHWDYRVGMNKAGEHFRRPVRIRFQLNAWAQVEMLVNAKTGEARMAVAQPIGTSAIENLVFHDPAAARPGPIAWQMHNAGLYDEFRDVRIEIDPSEDRLITVE
jgi:hypothetical protein